MGHPRRECPKFLARMNGKGGEVAALKEVARKEKVEKAREAKEERGNGMAKATSTIEPIIITTTSHQARQLEKASTTLVWNASMHGATNEMDTEVEKLVTGGMRIGRMVLI